MKENTKQSKEYEILYTNLKRQKKKNIYWGIIYGIITITILILLFHPLMFTLWGWFSLIGIRWIEYSLVGISFCAYLWGIPFLIQRLFYHLKLFTSEDKLLILEAQIKHIFKENDNLNK